MVKVIIAFIVVFHPKILKEGVTLDQVFRNVRAEVLSVSNGEQRPNEATQLTGKAFYLEKRKKTNLSDIIRSWNGSSQDLKIEIDKFLKIKNISNDSNEIEKRNDLNKHQIKNASRYSETPCLHTQHIVPPPY